MSGCDKLYTLLCERGPFGVHTSEIYERISNNPSQRAKDVEKKHGVTLDRKEEKYPDSDRMGTRYAIVGVGAGNHPDAFGVSNRDGGAASPPVSVDSGGLKERGGEEARTLSAASAEPPSAFDPFEQAA